MSGSGARNSLGIPISSKEVSNRADMLAEIRTTGGFGGAKLKPVSHRQNLTTTASAAAAGGAKKGKKIGGGGDMMADLKNFLKIKKPRP